MFKELIKKERGFTLVEIVLALAIGALILVIVFFAVSGAQRARRDDDRKNALSRISAQLEQYASNNNGAYPTSQAVFSGATFAGAYLTPTSSYTDPLSSTTYQFTGARVPTQTASAGVQYTISGRVYNVCINLEATATSCRTNQ